MSLLWLIVNIAGGKKILKNYLKAERNGSTFMDCRQRYALYNDRQKKEERQENTLKPVSLVSAVGSG